MKQQLVFPMAAYVLYIFTLGVHNFRTRLRAIKSGQVSIGYFRTFMGTPPPERVIVVGRHYDNQFQVPILFLVAGCAHLAINQINSFTVFLAWAFVGSRLAHSYIHLGTNNVRHRVVAFASGCLLTVLFWAQLLYFATQSESGFGIRFQH